MARARHGTKVGPVGAHRSVVTEGTTRTLAGSVLDDRIHYTRYTRSSVARVPELPSTDFIGIRRSWATSGSVSRRKRRRNSFSAPRMSRLQPTRPSESSCVTCSSVLKGEQLGHGRNTYDRSTGINRLLLAAGGRDRIGYMVHDRRNRAQVRIDGLEIGVRHRGKILPRHRRQNRT